MALLESPYHLPHNAIRIDEFEFMLKCIDSTKPFYSYPDLRTLFFVEEVKNDVFSTFHPTPHNKLVNHSSAKIRTLYSKAVSGDTDAMERLLEPDIMYTNKKTWKQVWNEFVRDYTEFFAFIGVLPSYYKGIKGGENRHIVSPLLKRFQKDEVSLEELILNFKFRNASKDYKNLDMYHIEVRPFVLALKALKFYERKGFKVVNPHIISAIVVYSQNEGKSLLNSLAAFPDPCKSIRDCKASFAKFTDAVKKEIGRVTLFLKPYLLEIGVVKKYSWGRSSYFEICNSIYDVKYPENCVFCNGEVGKYKLTPMIGKIISSCYANPDQTLRVDDIFDENFNDIDIISVLEEFKQLGIVSSYSKSEVKVSSLEKQFSINPYSDFMTISEAEYVDSCASMLLHDKQQIVIQENLALKSDLAELHSAALGSDGTLYESKLYDFLKKHLAVLNNLTWYGQATTGQRLSDIAATVKVFSNGETRNILLIMECKAGNAIAAFNERKEREDIINTMRKFEDVDFDGIWYWVVDSNSLPDVSVHGGYRSNALQKSLPEKLNVLQFEMSEQARRPAIVTAFSIDALTVYLNYLVSATHGLGANDKITELCVPHFWKWSKKFLNTQYVTIHKQMAF